MLSAADVLFHHIAGWKFERNGSSLLFSQGYSFLQLSFRAMYRADGMPASAEIARTLMPDCQQWCDFGSSGILSVARTRRCELCVVRAIVSQKFSLFRNAEPSKRFGR
jgi:hypothetical protein